MNPVLQAIDAMIAVACVVVYGFAAVILIAGVVSFIKWYRDVR